MASETYEFFKDLSNGKDINRWSYPDNLVYDIRQARGSNTIKVIITFEDDNDFLDILGVEPDNSTEDRYWWRIFNSRYRDFDIDRYRYDEDWREGYILQNFNNENLSILEEILKYTNPTLNLDSNDADISRFLKARFENEIDDLIYDYAVQQEECIYDGAKQTVMEETDNPFKRFGIIQKIHGYRFETTVNIILKLYRLLNAENEDLKGLLTKLHKRYSERKDIGQWADLHYQAWCKDYNNDFEQKNFKTHLEYILEEIKDNLEIVDLDEFNKLYDKVNRLGGFNKWIKIPEKNISVVFQSLDDKTNRLKIMVTKDDHTSHYRVVDNLEDLNLTLYHPELFESIKNNLRKFL